MGLRGSGAGNGEAGYYGEAIGEYYGEAVVKPLRTVPLLEKNKEKIVHLSFSHCLKNVPLLLGDLNTVCRIIYIFWITKGGVAHHVGQQGSAHTDGVRIIM